MSPAWENYMPCKSETRVINGKQVFVRQWPANKAMDMQIGLLTAMGDESLAFVMGDWNFGNLMYVLQRVEKHVFLPFVKECISSARIDGTEINAANFDVELSGELKFIYDLFSFVVEVNFKDFFVEGLAVMDEIEKLKKQNLLLSQTTQTEQSL